ncbi:MAG: hypothetical protein KC445_19170 [Anaerolineales bacterium]|nr:hypothetical protein [Anaerolineales bacterium]
MFQNLELAKILMNSPLLSRFSQNSNAATAVAQPLKSPSSANPILALAWPDGVQDKQDLPKEGELTIGNIVIKRARVRYYLERIDNAFPALLNGQSIHGARTLNDGDVLQIGELQTVFQLVA